MDNRVTQTPYQTGEWSGEFLIAGPLRQQTIALSVPAPTPGDSNSPTPSTGGGHRNPSAQSTATTPAISPTFYAGQWRAQQGSYECNKAPPYTKCVTNKCTITYNLTLTADATGGLRSEMTHDVAYSGFNCQVEMGSGRWVPDDKATAVDTGFVDANSPAGFNKNGVAFIARGSPMTLMLSGTQLVWLNQSEMDNWYPNGRLPDVRQLLRDHNLVFDRAN